MRQQRAIERSTLVLSSAAQRPAVAVARIQCHHRALNQSAPTCFRLYRCRLSPDRTISSDLSVTVECRANGEIDYVGRATLNDGIDDRADGVERVRIIRILGTPFVARYTQTLRLELRKPACRDVAFLHHQTQHEVAPGD